MESIRFEIHGAGPAVLLLHGFCESRQLWNPVIDLLPSGFEYILADIPGFGESDLPADPFTLKTIANSFWTWLQETEKTPITILGHSMGGYLALALAELAGDQCSGIGLIHSTAAADSPEKKENRTRSAEFIEKNGPEAFFRTFIPSLYYNGGPWEESVQQMVRATRKESIIRYTLAMRDRPDQRRWISHFPGKTLFLAGEEDSFIPADSLKKQAEEALDGKFVLLEGIGHLSMKESPQACAKAISEFLKP